MPPRNVEAITIRLRGVIRADADSGVTRTVEAITIRLRDRAQTGELTAQPTGKAPVCLKADVENVRL